MRGGLPLLLLPLLVVVVMALAPSLSAGSPLEAGSPYSTRCLAEKRTLDLRQEVELVSSDGPSKQTRALRLLVTGKLVLNGLGARQESDRGVKCQYEMLLLLSPVVRATSSVNAPPVVVREEDRAVSEVMPALEMLHAWSLEAGSAVHFSVSAFGRVENVDIRHPQSFQGDTVALGRIEAVVWSILYLLEADTTVLGKGPSKGESSLPEAARNQHTLLPGADYDVESSQEAETLEGAPTNGVVRFRKTRSWKPSQKKGAVRRSASEFAPLVVRTQRTEMFKHVTRAHDVGVMFAQQEEEVRSVVVGDAASAFSFRVRALTTLGDQAEKMFEAEAKRFADEAKATAEAAPKADAAAGRSDAFEPAPRTGTLVVAVHSVSNAGAGELAVRASANGGASFVRLPDSDDQGRWEEGRGKLVLPVYVDVPPADAKDAKAKDAKAKDAKKGHAETVKVRLEVLRGLGPESKLSERRIEARGEFWIVASDHRKAEEACIDVPLVRDALPPGTAEQHIDDGLGKTPKKVADVVSGPHARVCFTLVVGELQHILRQHEEDFGRIPGAEELREVANAQRAKGEKLLASAGEDTTAVPKPQQQQQQQPQQQLLVDNKPQRFREIMRQRRRQQNGEEPADGEEQQPEKPPVAPEKPPVAPAKEDVATGDGDAAESVKDAEQPRPSRAMLDSKSTYVMEPAVLPTGEPSSISGEVRFGVRTVTSTDKDGEQAVSRVFSLSSSSFVSGVRVPGVGFDGVVSHSPEHVLQGERVAFDARPTQPFVTEETEHGVRHLLGFDGVAPSAEPRESSPTCDDENNKEVAEFGAVAKHAHAADPSAAAETQNEQALAEGAGCLVSLSMPVPVFGSLYTVQVSQLASLDLTLGLDVCPDASDVPFVTSGSVAGVRLTTRVSVAPATADEAADWPSTVLGPAECRRRLSVPRPLAVGGEVDVLHTKDIVAKTMGARAKAKCSSIKTVFEGKPHTRMIGVGLPDEERADSGHADEAATPATTTVGPTAEVAVPPEWNHDMKCASDDAKPKLAAPANVSQEAAATGAAAPPTQEDTDEEI